VAGQEAHKAAPAPAGRPLGEGVRPARQPRDPNGRDSPDPRDPPR
jgi:hypothetical protein